MPRLKKANSAQANGNSNQSEVSTQQESKKPATENDYSKFFMEKAMSNSKEEKVIEEKPKSGDTPKEERINILTLIQLENHTKSKKDWRRSFFLIFVLFNSYRGSHNREPRTGVLVASYF